MDEDSDNSSLYIIIGGFVFLLIVVTIIYFIYKTLAGQERICDVRKDSSQLDSCMNCEYGYKNVGLNDLCCGEGEKEKCNVIKPGDATAGAICDTRKPRGEKDSCYGCRYGTIKKGLNDWCCQKFESKNCNEFKEGDAAAGSICDTRKSQGDKESCLECRYGFIRKGMNDWCCQNHEKNECNKIRINPDGTKSYTNKGGAICDMRKPSKDADSCFNCDHGIIKKGINDWCCQEFEKDKCIQIEIKKDGSKTFVNNGDNMCDTRKKDDQPDSCLNCAHGYKRKGLNDICCTEKEKSECTQIKVNPDGTRSYSNKGGSKCDTRKEKYKVDSCKNCDYGRIKKGLNDWCCQKHENCYTDNPHFKQPPKNKGGSMCDTRKEKHHKDSCKLCEYGRVKKGLNDWCCKKDENCHTDNPHFKQPPKNKGGSMCDTRKEKHHKDSCKLCEYGRVKKGLNHWCCKKNENCHTDNPHFKQPSKNYGGKICDTRKEKHHKDSCKLCEYGRVKKGLNHWCCKKHENCKTDNSHYVKPFWSKCYKDEECNGRRDDCIKRDCKKKGLTYKGKWHDCGGWRFKGYCQ